MSKLADQPAFPVPFTDDHDHIPGMTLRQHYVGLAMQGICADKGGEHIDVTNIAHWSVVIADALIAELERKPEA